MVMINIDGRCREKPGLFFRAVKLLKTNGITMVDSLRFFVALLRFSTDLLIKRNENNVYAVSYYIPGNKPLTVKLNELGEDIYFILRPRSGDAHDLLVGEHYEIFNWFYPNINDAIFVDVGAHIGGYTIRACKKAKYVIAIEPQKEAVDILRKNIQINSCNNVIIIEKAVWSSRGFALMKVPEGDEQKAMVSANGNVLVEIDTLDNIIRSLNVDRIDFLKVDIEGAEAEALYGMSETLKITKYLMIELRPSTLWIINYLLNNGYDIIDCVDHGAVTNFLFLNKKFK